MSDYACATRRLSNEFKKPQGTPFENGLFSLTMEFKPDYPMTAPTVYFKPPIFHPNVQTPNGWVCIDILNSTWTPTYSVSTILLSIQALLNNPNPDSPANPEAAELYTKNRGEYDRRVRQCVAASLKTEERKQSTQQ